MLRPAVYTFSRSAIADVMAQVAYHHPARHDEVVNWFKEVLEFYAKSVPEDNVVDSLLIAIMISHLVDLRAVDLLPLIEQLHKLGYVEEELNGNMDMVREKIEYSDPDMDYVKWELLPMEEHYEIIAELVAVDTGFGEQTLYPAFDSNGLSTRSEPLVKEKKVGRNDPCPCGSGKKYKKCCI
jgi:hypothetical protein